MNRKRALELLDPADLDGSFRKAVMKTHPDHGGDAADFQEVLTAREFLLRGEIETRSGWTPPGMTWPCPRSEAQFQKSVVHALKSRGAFVFNVHGQVMQSSGMPDLWVGHELWTGWLELKFGEGRYKPLQVKKAWDLRKVGSSVWGLRGESGREGLIVVEDLCGTEGVEDTEKGMVSAGVCKSWHELGGIMLRLLAEARVGGG